MVPSPSSSSGAGRCILGLAPSAAVAAPATAQDAEDECAAEARSQADDESQVLFDPGFDFGADVAVAAALWGVC